MRAHFETDTCGLRFRRATEVSGVDGGRGRMGEGGRADEKTGDPRTRALTPRATVRLDWLDGPHGGNAIAVAGKIKRARVRAGVCQSVGPTPVLSSTPSSG